MQYAVIQLQGHQYIVSEGDTITVDRIATDEDTYTVSDVLAVFEDDGSSAQWGAPYVKGVGVTFSVVEHTKGDKLHVYKFKNKNRYSRKIGFRAHQTILQVTSIA